MGFCLNCGYWLLTLSHRVQTFLEFIHAALWRMPRSLSPDRNGLGRECYSIACLLIRYRKGVKIPATVSLLYDLCWNRGVSAWPSVCFITDRVWDQEHITELKILGIIKAGFLQVCGFKRWWFQTEKCHMNVFFFNFDISSWCYGESIIYNLSPTTCLFSYMLYYLYIQYASPTRGHHQLSLLK